MRDIWEENWEKDFININRSSKIRSMTNLPPLGLPSRSIPLGQVRRFNRYICIPIYHCRIWGRCPNDRGDRKAHTHGA